MEYRTAPNDDEHALTDADNVLARGFSELRTSDDTRRREERDEKLHDAVCNNDIERIKTLLDVPEHLRTGLVNTANVACGYPLLFVACRGNTIEAGKTIELLLTLGANPNMVDAVGHSPLLEAIDQESLIACQLLLRHGADPDRPDKDGITPLGSAQLLQDSGECFMKCLLGHGANPCAVRCSTGNTLLHRAVLGTRSDLPHVSPNAVNTNDSPVISPNVDEVRLLLLAPCLKKLSDDKMQAFLEAKNEHGATALHVASRANDETVVMMLLSAGADIEARNNLQGTPLHNACREGSLQIVELLLKKNARTDAQNERGDTPLHLAARGNRFDIIRMMLAAGADAKIKNHMGYKAITPKTAKLLEAQHV